MAATHIVRNLRGVQDPVVMRDGPGTGKKVAQLGKDTAVRVIDQQVGPRLRYHEVVLTDPVVGIDLLNQTGFVKACDLRPIARAKTEGAWMLLPVADTKNADTRTAGESPALDKIWEAQHSCAPWVKKDPEAYWNSKYYIVYREPGSAVGMKSSDLVEKHTTKAIAQMMEYFDKSTKVEDLPAVLALMKHALGHEFHEDYCSCGQTYHYTLGIQF